MMSIAYPLRRDEREAVAMFLGHGASDPPPPSTAFCRPNVRIMRNTAATWSGWSPTSANTRYQSPEHVTPLRCRKSPKLQLKWAFGFAGDVTAFAAPTIVNGTLFVGSAGGTVNAIDAETGCLHWVYDANGPVRSAMAVIGTGAQTRLVFSDQIGGVHALDARTGKRLWKSTSRGARGDAPHGHPGRAQQRRLCRGGIVGRDTVDRSRTTRLYVPWQHHRPAGGRRRVVWKTYLVDPPEETGKTSVGTPTFGPSGVASGRCRRSTRGAASSTSPPETTTRTPPPRRATPLLRLM